MSFQCIRLLYLHLAEEFDGAESTPYNLLANLSPATYKVTLIIPGKLHTFFSSIPSLCIVRSEDIGLGLEFKASSSFSKNVKVVAETLSNGMFDLALGSTHYSSALLALAKKSFNVPTAAISCLRRPATHYLEHYVSDKAERAFLQNVFLSLCRISDGIIVPSGGLKDECVYDFDAEREKVTVIPDAVDIQTIKKKIREHPNVQFPAEFRIIGTVCRLAEEKNLPLLIRSFAEVRKDYRTKLVIIGDGPEKTNLENLVRFPWHRRRCLFSRFSGEPFQVYGALQHICAYLPFEGFGNSILEAMACKVPVIATDCPYGPREIIMDRKNGILVPMDDSEALSKALRTLLHNRELCSQIAREGHKTANSCSLEVMVKAYEKVFYDLFSSNSTLRKTEAASAEYLGDHGKNEDPKGIIGTFSKDNIR